MVTTRTLTVRSVESSASGKKFHSFQIDGMADPIQVSNIDVQADTVTVEFNPRFFSFVHLDAREPISGDLVQRVVID